MEVVNGKSEEKMKYHTVFQAESFLVEPDEDEDEDDDDLEDDELEVDEVVVDEEVEVELDDSDELVEEDFDAVDDEEEDDDDDDL